jgi:F-type H+-transporting ATPase subunit delta
MDQRVAQRYAQALMDLGEDRNSLDQIAEDMRTIEETISNSHELRIFLESPVIRPAQRLNVLRELFAKRLHPEVMLFVELIVKKDRSGLLGMTALEFQKLLDKKRNVVSAQVRSAIPLDKSEEQIIHAKLESMTGKNVIASFSIDPSIKGGFVARIGDTLIDASLQHQLEVLREQFKRGGSAIMN